MSKKEELLSEIKKLSSKIGSVKVYFNKHKTGGNNGMGYYFDKKTNYGNLMFAVNIIILLMNQRTKLLS